MAFQLKRARDWFEISLVKGKKYEFECKEISALDADLYLRDQYGNQISYDNNSGSDPDDPKITYTATSTGTYFLDVGDFYYHNLGNYQLYAKEIASSVTVNIASCLGASHKGSFPE